MVDNIPSDRWMPLPFGLEESFTFETYNEKIRSNFTGGKNFLSIWIRERYFHVFPHAMRNKHRIGADDILKSMLPTMMSIKHDDPNRRLKYLSMDMMYFYTLDRMSDIDEVIRGYESNRCLYYFKDPYFLIHAGVHSVLIGNDIPLLKVWEVLMEPSQNVLNNKRRSYSHQLDILHDLIKVLKRDVLDKVIDLAQKRGVHWSLYNEDGKITPYEWNTLDPMVLFQYGKLRAFLRTKITKKRRRNKYRYTLNKALISHLPKVPAVFKKMSNSDRTRIFAFKDDMDTEVFSLDPSVDIKDVQNEIKELEQMSELTFSQHILRYESIDEFIIDHGYEEYANSPALSHLVKGNPDFDKFIQDLANKHK